MTNSSTPLRHDLPLSEPDGDDLEARRRDLKQNLNELQDVFKYMGTGHPDHKATETRIEQMRTMLAQIDASLGD